MKAQKYFFPQTGWLLIFFFCISIALSAQEAALAQTQDGWGYIRQENTWLIKPQFEKIEAERYFDSHLPASTVGYFSEGMVRYSIGGVWGFYNDEGTNVIKEVYADASDFSDSLAAVKKSVTWGYINKKGEWVIKSSFEEAGNFVNGLAPVKSGNRWGYIDKSGKWIIDPVFKEAYRFKENLALVKSKGGYGYINKRGDSIIQPSFSDAFSFKKGMAKVKTGDGFGYIDTAGNYIIKPAYGFIKPICISTFCMLKSVVTHALFIR